MKTQSGGLLGQKFEIGLATIACGVCAAVTSVSLLALARIRFGAVIAHVTLADSAPTVLIAATFKAL